MILLNILSYSNHSTNHPTTREQRALMPIDASLPLSCQKQARIGTQTLISGEIAPIPWMKHTIVLLSKSIEQTLGPEYDQWEPNALKEVSMSFSHHITSSLQVIRSTLQSSWTTSFPLVGQAINIHSLGIPCAQSIATSRQPNCDHTLCDVSSEFHVPLGFFDLPQKSWNDQVSIFNPSDEPCAIL